LSVSEEEVAMLEKDGWLAILRWDWGQYSLSCGFRVICTCASRGSVVALTVPSILDHEVVALDV
jgi:hypothetical protein